MAKSKAKQSSKKALLKKMIGKVKKANRKGASPIKLDNGLGNEPLKPGSGNGSNLGLNGIF
jgi:hypothetical protein